MTDTRGKRKPSKAVVEVAWTLVRKENSEIRESHPKAYRWARACIDTSKEL